MLFGTPCNNSVADNQADEWLKPKRFALILAALIFVAFPDVVLGMHTFIARDFGYFGYPLAYFHREHFWRGEIPLWNPLSYCGLPFLAQWNTLTLYPLSLIYLLFPLTWSLPIFCLFHLWLAGFGMYFLAYRWTGSRLAAACAGTAFAFNGLMLNCLMWPNNIAALGWMPWVVLTLETAWLHGGRKIIVAGLIAAMQFLAGGPEIFLLTWLFAGSLMLVFVFRNREIWFTTFLRFGGVGLLFLALIAAQLLPFLELMSYSHRDKDFGNSGWSMPLGGWANFLVPLFHCGQTSQGFYMQDGQGWTTSYYAGIVVAWLALLSLVKRRNWYVATLLVCVLASLLLALGDDAYVYRVARYALPFLRVMRYPVKFVVLTIFALPLLAAFALTSFREKTANQLRRLQLLIGAVFLLLIIVTVFWAKVSPAPGENWESTLKSGISRALFLVMGALAVHWWTIAKGRRAWIASLVLLALIWADAFTLEPSQIVRAATWVYEPGWVAEKTGMRPVPRHGESRAMHSPAAYYELHEHAMGSVEKNYSLARIAVFSNCNLLDGLPKVNGFFSLYPREIYTTVSLLYTQTNRDYSATLDFLGISQITMPGKVFDWIARTNWMPMVTVGQKPLFGDDEYIFGAFYYNADFRKYVFLPKELQPEISITNQTAARVTASEFHNNGFTVAVESQDPTMMVIAQTYYPCWHAYVDGNPTRIFRANYAFQALQVPAGRHQVRIAYEDRRFYLGAAISFATLIACLGFLVVSRKRVVPTS